MKEAILKLINEVMRENDKEISNVEERIESLKKNEWSWDMIETLKANWYSLCKIKGKFLELKRDLMPILNDEVEVNKK